MLVVLNMAHNDKPKKIKLQHEMDLLLLKHEHEIKMLKLEQERKQKELERKHELEMLELRGGLLGKIFGCS